VKPEKGAKSFGGTLRYSSRETFKNLVSMFKYFIRPKMDSQKCILSKTNGNCNKLYNENWIFDNLPKPRIVNVKPSITVSSSTTRTVESINSWLDWFIMSLLGKLHKMSKNESLILVKYLTNLWQLYTYKDQPESILQKINNQLILIIQNKAQFETLDEYESYDYNNLIDLSLDETKWNRLRSELNVDKWAHNDLKKADLSNINEWASNKRIMYRRSWYKPVLESILLKIKQNEIVGKERQILIKHLHEAWFITSPNVITPRM